jgi:HTH-type transcriptional regulator/antitoxin MqsA
MYPSRCPECGGKISESLGPLEVPLRGQSVKVDGIPHGVCSGCGETYLGIDEMEQLQKAAVDQARQAQGLLRPDEIRSLRVALGNISQTRLEHLLGVGAKTVVRWEKGTVFQSATADRLMRLLRAMPELADVLEGGELYRDVRVACRSEATAHYDASWRTLKSRGHLHLVTEHVHATAA